MAAVERVEMEHPDLPPVVDRHGEEHLRRVWVWPGQVKVLEDSGWRRAGQAADEEAEEAPADPKADDGPAVPELDEAPADPPVTTEPKTTKKRG